MEKVGLLWTYREGYNSGLRVKGTSQEAYSVASLSLHITETRLARQLKMSLDLIAEITQSQRGWWFAWHCTALESRPDPDPLTPGPVLTPFTWGPHPTRFSLVMHCVGHIALTRCLETWRFGLVTTSTPDVTFYRSWGLQGWDDGVRWERGGGWWWRGARKPVITWSGLGEVGAQDSSPCDRGCLTHRQQGWGIARNQILAVPLAGPYVREDMKDMEDPLSARRSSPEVGWSVLEIPAHLCRPYWMAVSR